VVRDGNPRQPWIVLQRLGRERELDTITLRARRGDRLIASFAYGRLMISEFAEEV